MQHTTQKNAAYKNFSFSLNDKSLRTLYNGVQRRLFHKKRSPCIMNVGRKKQNKNIEIVAHSKNSTDILAQQVPHEIEIFFS